MDKIKTFFDLNAWKEAHKLTLEIYKITRNFPKEELYSLTSQLRRASISVTSNIAEGFSRNSCKEKIQFYYIAHGSITEIQSQVFLAKDLCYIDLDQYVDIFSQTIVVSKLINGLIKSLREFNP